MTLVEQQFQRRVAGVPAQGIGLSVDVYAPNLFELIEALEARGLAYGYLEIFKAPSEVLARVRRRVPSAGLEYHGEGVWVTQPDMTDTYPWDEEMELASCHLRTLGSHWINLECASKQMAGYSFGTYLPPLFCRASANATARNVRAVQHYLDRVCATTDSPTPLLLIEMPPLTYFAFGDLSVPEFFRLIADRAPCGVVLDIGHLWTIYRYSGPCREQTLGQFLGEFLDVFPLQRVVQIHVAGLGPAPDVGQVPRGTTVSSAIPELPLWIDAHASPVPEVLLEMLELVLAHPKLEHLKGLALEVDTKSVECIVSEFQRLRERFGQRLERSQHRPSRPSESMPSTERRAGHSPVEADDEEALLRAYGEYVLVAAGKANLPAAQRSVLRGDPALLALYSREYLPREILEWGGNLRHVFPETCRQLEGRGIPLMAFVEYWFRAPRAVHGRYDFFLLKLDRFVEFVQDVMPQASETAAREAAEMRGAYQHASELVGT